MAKKKPKKLDPIDEDDCLDEDESPQEDRPSFNPNKAMLDVEWEQQPDLYFHYATALADARLALAQESSAMDVTKAELDRDIRANPDEFGLDEKPTEAALKAAIILQPEYTKQQKKIEKAQHLVNMMSAAVVACDHKKKSLENLAYLYGANYFSAPHDRGEDARPKKKREGKSARTAVRREDLNKDDDDGDDE